MNQSLCEVTVKDDKLRLYKTTTLGYLIAAKSKCWQTSLLEKKEIREFENGVIFQPYNFTGAFTCKMDSFYLRISHEKLYYNLLCAL